MQAKVIAALVTCHDDAIPGLLHANLQILQSSGVHDVITGIKKRLEAEHKEEVKGLQKRLREVQRSRIYPRTCRGLLDLLLDLTWRRL